MTKYMNSLLFITLLLACLYLFFSALYPETLQKIYDPLNAIMDLLQHTKEANNSREHSLKNKYEDIKVSHDQSPRRFTGFFTEVPHNDMKEVEL